MNPHEREAGVLLTRIEPNHAVEVRAHAASDGYLNIVEWTEYDDEKWRAVCLYEMPPAAQERLREMLGDRT